MIPIGMANNNPVFSCIPKYLNSNSVNINANDKSKIAISKIRTDLNESNIVLILYICIYIKMYKGRFEDVNDFRQQLGLTKEEMPDDKALEIMHLDNKEHIKMLNKEKQQLEAAKRKAESEHQRLMYENRQLANSRKNNIFMLPRPNLLSSVHHAYVDPVEDAINYLKREQLKKEIREELEREYKKTKTRSKSKTKKKTKTRSKSKTKKKTKTRSKSKTKKTTTRSKSKKGKTNKKVKRKNK